MDLMFQPVHFNPELATRARFADNANTSAHKFDQQFADDQADARTFNWELIGIKSIKWIKEATNLLRGKSIATVMNR